MSLPDEGETFLDDGQGLEPEEVHFQHSDLLYIVSVILGCPHLLLGRLVRCKGDRNIVGEVAPSDDHRAGVYSDLSYASFQLDGIFKDILYRIRPVLVFVLEFGQIFHAVLEIGLEFLFLLDLLLRPVLLPDRFFGFRLENRLVRHHLGEPCRFLYRKPADPRHILYRALGGHCAECDNVRYVILAVGLLDVLECTVAALIIEVDVYIRHRDTVRVQETLEQQVVPDRVEIGDFQTVCDYGPGSGTSSRAYRRADGPCCGDEVLDNEEVVRESHPGDGLQLELYPFRLFPGERLPVSFPCPFITEVAEVCDRPCEFLSPVVPFLVAPSDIDYVLVFFEIFLLFRQEGRIDLEFREDVVPVDFVALYLVEHLHGPFQHFRMVREERQHFLLAFEVFLLGVPHPVRRVEVGVAVEADEPVMRRPVLLADEMHIICGKYLDSGLF